MKESTALLSLSSFLALSIYFSIPLYSDQVLACFQFRLCVAGSQSVTEVAPPKKWVTSQHCTRLKKEIKVAPAASKKEKFVAQWRLCKLRKKKTTTVKTENHFMPLKGKRYGEEKEFCLKTFQQIILFILNGFSYHYPAEVVLLPLVAAEKVWWRHSAQLFPTHERIPILETSCLNLFYRP